ncbi:hypothetical protein DFJ63DRAFT_314579 [Scheffersomyces coipomensis]|uniref:uncharacterized protein n=1 Tax=Scheffersomyces coipomensis TaxID=1788519 RepID=UPI00315D0740
MRSSIFSSDPPLLSSKKTKTTKKSKVSSPYISSPVTPQLSTKFSNSGSNTPLLDIGVTSSNSKPKLVSWNIEELLASYNETGHLPPPLSPTLPDSISDQQKRNREREIVSPNPKHVLKKSSIIDDDDNDEEIVQSRIVSSSKNFTKAKDNIPDDDIPLSILSPTLPSIFDHNSNATNTPESTVTSATVIPVDSNKMKSSKKRLLVRFINKANDPNKPRFLVRISFTNKEKYQEVIKGKTVRGPTGLGIYIREPDPEREPEAEPEEESDTSIIPLGSIKKSSKEEVVLEDRKLDARLKELAHKEKLIKEKENQIEKQEQDLLLIEKNMKDEIKKQKETNEKELQDKEIRLKEYERSLRSKERAIEEREQKQKQKSPPVSSRSDDINKRREQLKQLNNEVMIKEPSQPLEEIKLPNSEEQQTLHLPKAMREEINATLQNKKTILLQLSKTAKGDFESSINKDNLKAVICQVDYVLLKLMASDYDERSKLVMDVLPSERSWKVLDQEVSDLIKFINNCSKSIKDNMISGFLRILTSILYQTRALIIKRVNSILIKVIDSYLTKRDDRKELNDKIIELQQTTIGNNNLISAHLMNARPDFLFSNIASKFPITWSKRNLNLEAVQRDFNLYDFHKHLRPAYQLYYLPFGAYSNVNEIDGFLFHIMNEFMDIYNKHNPSTRVSYVLLSGKPH